jgi:excisionase family DNA binding protein
MGTTRNAPSSKYATLRDGGSYQQDSPDPERLLRAQEVAKILQFSRALAYRLMQNEELPAVKFHQSTRVRQKDLDAFIRRNMKSTEDW